MKYLLTIAFFLLTTILAQAQALSGDYTVGSAEGSDYASLHAAVEALKTNGISGDVTLLIAEDLQEGENIFLGLDTDGHTLTIRPAAGTTPTVTFTAADNNTNINGALVVGASSDDWDTLVETRNVTIDGSNTVGGTTRDLTLTTTASTGTSNYVRILGTARDVTIRNTVIAMEQGAFDTVLISPLQYNGTDWPARDIALVNNRLVSNADRSSSRAVNVWGVTGTGFETPGTVTGPISITGNDIQARRYGIWLRSFTGNTTISGNSIAINETGTLAAYGIITEASLSDAINIAITGNAITRLTGGGIVKGMSLSASGTYAVYNNTVTGFEANDPNADGTEFYGIHVETPPLPETINVSLYHNSVYMNPLGVTGLSGWRYRGLQSNSNARITVDVRNNVVINADDSEATSFVYYQFGTASTITSDDNNFFVANTSGDNNFFGRLSGSGGTNLTDLAAWQTETELDAATTSIAVEFEDTTTLEPDPGMFAEEALRAPLLELVTTDIAGTEREVPNFKGAWQIEDPTSTSLLAHADQPDGIELLVNYPNPFNPATTIRFALNQTESVQLDVFTPDGRRVATLLRSSMPAGEHTVTFRAENLASGVYLYRLTAGSTVLTQTMTLIK